MSQTYIFHREGSFYPIEFADDATAIWHAKYNPGTLKVTDPQGSRTVWEVPVTQTYLTLRKVEEKDLKSGQQYLVNSRKTGFEVYAWHAPARSFKSLEIYLIIAEVTAIYELPK